MTRPTPDPTTRTPRSPAAAWSLVAASVVVAAAVASIGDYFHMFTGAIRYDDFDHFTNFQAPSWLLERYPGPVDFRSLPIDVRIWRQVFVLIPFFVTVFSAMGLLAWMLDRRRTPSERFGSGGHSPATRRVAVEQLLCFAILYLLSGFANGERELLTITFVLVWLLRLSFERDRSFAVLYSLLVGLGGPFYEGVVLRVPYREPAMWGVAPWLFPMYAVGALAYLALLDATQTSSAQLADEDAHPGVSHGLRLTSRDEPAVAHSARARA